MRLAVLPSLVLLAGCAAPQEAYPSLAPRAGEAVDPRLAVAPLAARAADPAVAGWLAAAERRAEEAHARFRAVAARTPPVAGVPGSGSWVDGQERLSALEAERAPLVAVLAEVDRELARRVAAGPVAEADRAAFAAASARIAALVEDSAATVRAKR